MGVICRCHGELRMPWGCLGRGKGFLGSVFGESLGCLVGDKGALEVLCECPGGFMGRVMGCLGIVSWGAVGMPWSCHGIVGQVPSMCLWRPWGCHGVPLRDWGRNIGVTRAYWL